MAWGSIGEGLLSGTAPYKLQKFHQDVWAVHLFSDLHRSSLSRQAPLMAQSGRWQLQAHFFFKSATPRECFLVKNLIMNALGTIHPDLGHLLYRLRLGFSKGTEANF